jgi:hypothetical protein
MPSSSSPLVGRPHSISNLSSSAWWDSCVSPQTHQHVRCMEAKTNCPMLHHSLIYYTLWSLDKTDRWRERETEQGCSETFLKGRI